MSWFGSSTLASAALILVACAAPPQSDVNLFDRPGAVQTAPTAAPTTAAPAPALSATARAALAANDPSAVRQQSKVDINPFRGLTTVEGPAIFPEGNMTRGYFLRGWVSHNADAQAAIGERHQVYVMATFSDWAFLDRAYAGGRTLAMTEIARKVGTCTRFGCTVYESVGINLNGAELAAAATGGLAFEVAGRSGNVRLIVPAAYFQGYYEAYKAALANPTTP